ncbi:MAG: LysE family transporter [Bacteroidota bacterium]
MSYILTFALAVLFSFLGVLPPGIVNMTVANYSAKKSIKKAKKFIYGAVSIVLLQSALAYYFATFLQDHPAVIQNLKLVGSVVFILLTLFFLGKGIQGFLQSKEKVKQKPAKSKLKPFYHGVFISAVNVFPIPYYAFVSLYMSAFIPDFFNYYVGLLFILGATLGTFLVFIGYAHLFRKIKHKVSFFTNNINFIIASITALIAIFTIYNFI